jgi:methyl-accepting chemotaxis protein
MLNRLVPDIRKTAELVSEISAACREQDIGASPDQRSDPAARQGDPAERRRLRQMSATSEELAAQAEELQASIAFFRIEDGNSRKAAARPRPAAPRAGQVRRPAPAARKPPRPTPWPSSRPRQGLRPGHGDRRSGRRRPRLPGVA